MGRKSRNTPFRKSVCSFRTTEEPKARENSQELEDIDENEKHPDIFEEMANFQKNLEEETPFSQKMEEMSTQETDFSDFSLQGTVACVSRAPLDRGLRVRESLTHFLHF